MQNIQLLTNKSVCQLGLRFQCERETEKRNRQPLHSSLEPLKREYGFCKFFRKCCEFNTIDGNVNLV